MDLSKAFDTLNHQILLSKLEHYGIQGVALQWIDSYLSNRLQFVQFNQSRSSDQIMRCGVPQGSVLGPLLFLIYINDLPNATNLTETVLFADDTSIFYSHSNITHLIATLNNELNNINIWMKANKLSVNIEKTNYIVFKSRQKKINDNFALFYDTKLLKQKHDVNFLGVYIDENLNWKPHINHVCNKISKSIGILYKSRFYLSTKTKLSDI